MSFQVSFTSASHSPKLNQSFAWELKNLSNEKLVSRLKEQVSQERKLQMEVLYTLQEVEVRRLHLQMGYPDLYTFAQKELGYSSGAAYRRIASMKLLKTFPDMAPKLESGELGLENATQAQSFFRKEDERRKEAGEEKLSLELKREVVTELLNKSTREAQRILTEKSPELMMPTEKAKPLAHNKTLVQFVATQELMEKLNELKDLTAHQNYEGRMDVLIEKLADLALKKLKPNKVLKAKSGTETGAAPQTQTQTESETATETAIAPSSSPAPRILRRQREITRPHPIVSKRSRHIPAKVRHEVLKKQNQGCAYQDPKSKRFCGSKHGLQFDHIQPFSQGGSHTLGNLRLFCGAHNRFRTI